MLDHLKQERQADSAARERTRLAIFVGALLLFGGALLAVSRSRDSADRDSPAATSVAEDAGTDGGADTARAANPFEADALIAAVAKDEGLPHRWAWHGFEYLETIRRHGHFPVDFEPVVAQDLVAKEGAFPVGRAVEFEGRVIDRAQDEYKPPGTQLEHAVLWSLVVEDPRGDTFVVTSRGDGQRTDAGAPKALAPSLIARPIEVGDTILVRGIALQDRVGTLAETVLRERTPVVYSTAVRRDVPAEIRAVPIAWPDHVDWDEVKDLTLAQTMRTDDDAIFQLLQWAQARGIDQLRKDLESGKLPWTEWDSETFREVWQPEVDPEGDGPRTFTNKARGQVFRLDGVVADAQVIGWDQVPPNTSRVHEFSMLTMLADDYHSVAVRCFSPFPLTDFDKVEARRKDHVRVYGIFVKNHSYRARHKDRNTKDYGFRTVPLFILIAAEPHPGASDYMMSAMYWIAGGMVLLALLFYFVLVRGGRKQMQRMEAQRAKLREKRLTTESPGA